MKIFKQAFTIAEVLITIGIIGIVAAITIPTLMQNTSDAQLKTAWKKSFAALSNATNLMKTENGGGMTGLFTSGTSSMLSEYSNKLNVSKTCLTNSETEKCIASRYYKALKGTGSGGTDALNIPGIILNDGTSIVFYQSGTQALNCDRALSTVPPLSQTCGNLYVDVNGLKPPNVLGRDLFLIFVTHTGAYPAGANAVNFTANITDMTDFTISCNPANTSFTWSGMGCGAKYLLE